VVVCTAKDLTEQERGELRSQVEYIVQTGSGPDELLRELVGLRHS